MALNFLNNGYFAGKVGIGTESPGAKLEIKDGNLWLNGVTSNYNPEIFFIDDAGPTGIAGAKIRYENSNGNLYFDHKWDTATSGFFFRNRVDGTPLDTMSLVNGSVGIGTTGPARQLTVFNSSNAELELYSGTTSSGFIYFRDSGDSNIGALQYDHNGDYMSFRVNDAERMRIDSNGDVGIGITNPILKLHIEGTNSLPATSGIAQNGGIRIENGVNNGVLDIGASNATGAPGWLQATDKADLSQAYKLLLNPNGGNVGIGVTNPSQNLHISSSVSTGLLLESTYATTGKEWLINSRGADSSFQIYNETDSVDALRILSNGNVGIGFASPQAPLSFANVVGNKIDFYYNTTTNDRYGIQVQSNELRIHSGAAGDSTGGITFGKDNGTTFTEAMRVRNDGNVGIGTTSPKTSLDIVKDSDIWHLMVGGATKKLLVGGQAASGDVVLQAGAASTVNNAAVTTPYNLCLQRDGGNVGIGTASPGYKLDVAEKIRMVGGLKITPTTSNLYAEDGALSYYGSTNGVYLNGAGANGWLRLQASGVENDQNSINIYGSASAYMTFRTANSTRMIINSAGNVGIGTTGPSSKLELGPNGSLGANITNKNVILNVDGGYGTTGTPTSGQYKVIGFTGTTKDVTDITGQTGGETQKNFYLGIIGGDYFNVNRFSFWQGGSERLTIQGYGANAGNVGIGTTSPSEKLVVDGKVIINNTNPPNNIAQLNIGYTGSGETRAIDIDGNWTAGESKSITFAYGNDATHMVGQINCVFNNSTDSRLRWGKLYHGGATSTYTMQLKSTSATTADLTVAGSVNVNTNGLINFEQNTDIDTGAEVVAQVAHATYTAAFFDFVVKKGTNVRSGTVYACHNGDTTPLVEFTETSTQDLGDTSDVTLSVDISGGNMRLLATVTSDDWSVKSLIRAI